MSLITFKAGERFFKLTFLTDSYVEDGVRRYSARCDCGNLTTPRHDDIRRGHSRACLSCANSTPRQRDPANRGKSSTPIYRAWTNMLTRAKRSENTARGIGVCADWQKFSNFEAWAVEGFENGLTLDRIDNDRGYAPDNCRWVTNAEQQANKSRRLNEAISERIRQLFNTTDMTQAEIAAEVGVSTWAVSRVINDPIVAAKMNQLRRPARKDGGSK